MSSLLWLLVAAAAVWLLVRLVRRSRGHPRDWRREAYTPVNLPVVSGRHTLDKVPRPALPSQAPGDLNRSPLAPYLAKALDEVPVDAAAPGQDSPWTYDEVRALATRLVARVNSRNPGLNLALVSFDAVTKTVDAAKTLRYQFDAQVHAPGQNLSGRVTVKAVVTPDNREFIRDIAVHGARADTTNIMGSAGIDGHVEYAKYEPVVSYVPQPV